MFDEQNAGSQTPRTIQKGMRKQATRMLRSIAAPSRLRQRFFARPPSAGSRGIHQLFGGEDAAPLMARTQEEMEHIGARVAKNRRDGDVIFLKGCVCAARTISQRVRSCTD